MTSSLCVRAIVPFAVWVGLAGTAMPAPQQAPAPAAVSAQPAPLTYDAALQVATAQNAGLAAALRQRAIRQADVRIAGQRPNPDVTFEASRDTPHEVLSFGIPLEIGGQRSRRIELAREQLGLADLDVRTAERTLRRNLRDAFYGLLAADERVRAAQEVVEIVRRVRDISNTRFTEGAAPRLEVMEAELGLARVEAELETARSARAAIQADLNAVLNRPPGNALAVTGDMAAMPPPAPFDQLLKTALASNVDLAQVDREIAIERRRTNLLKAERTPTPTFSVGGVFDAPGEFSAGWSGGVSMAIPLFSRNQGEIAQSSATVTQLQAQREAVLRTLENSLYSAWSRLQAQRDNVDRYRDRLLPTSTQIASLAEESYKQGRSPLLNVLEAQRVLRDVRREYLQALMDFQTAIAELEEMLGARIQ